MKPISADSHVVEGRDVFTGLAERFGDEAPRIMDVGDQVDAIVIPARGLRGVSVARMGMAATRLARNEPLNRKPGHKPDVAHMKDPELVALFNSGYAGMRKGLVDGAHRYEDQDADGLAAEFLYPGFFGMFGMANTPLQVALQKNYNDWLHDYTTASNGRLFGLPAIPVQDPEAATDEIDRVIKMGFKGGCIPCTSPADAPYFDDVYEPIWARAEEAGFPLSMHVGCNAYLPKERRNTAHRPDAIADYAATQGTVQRTIVEFMCRGVCERHPDLKIVVAEFKRRLDRPLARPCRSGPAAGTPQHGRAVHRNAAARGLAPPVLRDDRGRSTGARDTRTHRPRQPDVGIRLPAHRLDVAVLERRARRVVRGSGHDAPREDHAGQREGVVRRLG